MSGKMNNIILIGPFPPPVYGMSKNLQNYYNLASERNVNTHKIDISSPQLNRGLKTVVIKSLKILIGFAKLIYLLLVNIKKTVYIPPDGEKGMFASFIFVAISRMLGARVILHHRSYNYITRSYLCMQLICNVGGQSLEHIFLASKMEHDYFEIYPRSKNTYVVSNVSMLPDITCKTNKRSSNLRIGHLSNLGFSKGLDRTVKTFEMLHNIGVNPELHLAGPPENKEVKNYISKLLLQSPLRKYIIYHDSVYGERKTAFYESIDFFIFPTLYKHEAQPNVVFEAAQKGVPTIATDVGCLSSDIKDNINGFIVRDPNHFAEHAALIIKGLMDKNLLEEISLSTINKINTEITSSKIQLHDIISKLTTDSKI